MGSGRLYFFFPLTIRIAARWGEEGERRRRRKRRKKKSWLPRNTNREESLLVLPCLLKVFLGFRFWFSLIELSIPGGEELLSSSLSWFVFCIYLFPFFCCCCSFILTCILLSVSPSLDRQTPGLHGHVWCTHTHTHTHTLKSKDTLVRGARKSEGISRWRGISRLCVPFEYRSSSCRLVVAMQVCCCCCCCCCCASSASPASEQRSTDWNKINPLFPSLPPFKFN